MDMITAQGVTFQYDNPEEAPRLVLEGIDLSIEKGSFVALLGHNGSGKSTLAKHFNAMLLPTGGRVLVEGIDTAEEEQKYEIRRMVGMVLQNPDNQLVSTIVEEDVAFGPENLGVPPEEIRRRVDDALRAVDMYDYREHAPDKLSGGQKQRVAIAGILAMQPDCIVLDEPTAMLDPKGRKEIVSTVLKLNKEKHITIVYITHKMEEAILADRIIAMEKGKIVLEGTPKEVFTQVDRIRGLGLECPLAAEVADALDKQGHRLPPIITHKELCEALCPSK